ncbi:MAG: hypothetical protein KDM81_19740, partial [Verrucomicrobiae bacterium]|nr:hypothetical protein [Verrucomicrobiae bacterium]
MRREDEALVADLLHEVRRRQPEDDKGVDRLKMALDEGIEGNEVAALDSEHLAGGVRWSTDCSLGLLHHPP